MTFEEMDLSEFPPDYKFTEMVERQMYLWEAYKPTTIEADIPFEQDWWKYVYWMPKIKKDFYLMTLSALDLEKEIQKKCVTELKMDYWFFTKHYKFFLKRLDWMRKQGATHAGELKC